MPGPLKPLNDPLNVGPLQEKYEDPRSKMLNSIKNMGDWADGAVYDNGEDRVLLPRHPAAFRPEPFVNDPLAQQMLHRIMRKVPAVANGIGKVTVGPDINTVDRFERKSNDLPGGVLDYDKSNLLGTTNTDTGDISLNPRLVTSQKSDLLRTLTHELTHAAGFGDGSAYPIGNMMANMNKGVK